MNEPKESPAPEALPVDAGLSRLYRAAAGAEPSAALDAAILRAARAAVAPKPAPASLPWWKRLKAPVAVAATVMLAVMLTLTVDRNPPEVARESSQEAVQEKAQNAPQNAVPPAVLSVPSSVPADVHTERSDRAGVAKGSVPAASVAAPVAIVDRAEKKAKAAESVPAVPQLAAPPAAMESSSEAVTTRAGKLENAEGRSSTLPGRARSADAAPAPAMAPAGAAAPMLESTAKRAAPRPEIVWLEEIRALRRQGREDEAARRLAEFRLAYPDYPLPEDLK
jgi:hypothetical protein